MGPGARDSGAQGEGGRGGAPALRRHERVFHPAARLSRAPEKAGHPVQDVRPAHAVPLHALQLPRSPQDSGDRRPHSLQRRRQPGGRVHQPQEKVRPLEGHRRHAQGRGREELYAHVPAVVAPAGQGRGIRPVSRRADLCAGARQRLRHPLRRLPGGRRQARRARVPGHPQPRPALCAHHDAVPDSGQRDGKRAHLCRGARRGRAHHHAGHPRQGDGLRAGQDVLSRADGRRRAHLRVHAGLRAREGLHLRRRDGGGRHDQPGLPQPVPPLRVRHVPVQNGLHRGD